MDDLYDHIFHRQILDWNQGNHCPLEKYLNELGNPEMSPDILVDLVYHEMRIKLEMAETPDVEDYCRRFPKVQEEIRAQWEFHELLEEEFAEETVETGIGGTSADTLILKPPEIPGYQIYESLGRGATGVVYRALQISLNRIVALKVLHPPSDQSQAESHTRAQKAIELFRQEAERVANLKDDHIVEVYDFGEHEGLLFFAM